MQTSILQFFQNIANPLLDQAAEYTTMLGEEGIYILIVAVFFWAVSKKKGFILASTLLVSLFFNTFLKTIFQAPRPFETIPGFQGKRLETATGYSFPSGHTQGASSFYTALIYLFKNKVLRISSILAIFLVGISRLYLGVHWPLDVAAGWAIGITTAWFIASQIDNLWDKPDDLMRFFRKVILITLIITAGITAFELFRFKGNVKIEDFFKGSGMILGCFSGFLLEMTYVRFEPASGSKKIKILRVITGLTGVFILQTGLKLILPDFILSHFLRYGAMGFWITFLFPILGSRIHLFET